MKNCLKINHTDMTIVMDRTFAKSAANTRSDEYNHLQKIRADYPEYRVIQRQIRRNVKKKTYAGLTYDYMKAYIMGHGTEDERKKNLKDLEEKILIASCHSKAFRYPVIKSWFLELYPEIAQFGLKNEEAPEQGNSDTSSINTDLSVIAKGA